jgi:hypothetical protein
MLRNRIGVEMRYRSASAASFSSPQPDVSIPPFWSIPATISSRGVIKIPFGHMPSSISSHTDLPVPVGAAYRCHAPGSPSSIARIASPTNISW